MEGIQTTVAISRTLSKGPQRCATRPKERSSQFQLCPHALLAPKLYLLYAPINFHVSASPILLESWMDKEEIWRHHIRRKGP